MAITKLSITGNTTAVGISSTPIVVSLGNTAQATTVTASGNITATNAQTALEQLDTIKVQASGGTLTNPSISGNVSVTGDVTASGINLGDTTLSDYEFGTWTPTNSDITFTTSYAKYTRIGNLVIASLDIDSIDCSNVPVDTSNFVINGLPYNSAIDLPGQILKYTVTSIVNTTRIAPVATTNGEIAFYHGGHNGIQLDNEDINTGQTDGHIVATVIYMTS